MSTETKNGIVVSNEALQAHHLTITRIDKLKKHAGGLQVAGIKDYAGLREVVRTRKFIKGLRLDVDDKRKELNAPLLQQMRDNNYAAKFIIAALKPSETHLRNIEKEIANQKEAIKLEKKRKALERLQKRIEQLTAFDVAFDLEEVEKATDEEFSLMLDKARFAYEAAQETKRIQAEQLRMENEKLRVENEELKKSITPPVNVSVYEPVHEDVVNPVHVEMPKELSDVEKAAIIKKVRDYALALQAIEVPELPEGPAKTVFNNAHVQITNGINMLLKAVE